MKEHRFFDWRLQTEWEKWPANMLWRFEKKKPRTKDLPLIILLKKQWMNNWPTKKTLLSVNLCCNKYDLCEENQDEEAGVAQFSIRPIREHFLVILCKPKTVGTTNWRMHKLRSLVYETRLCSSRWPLPEKNHQP